MSGITTRTGAPCSCRSGLPSISHASITSGSIDCSIVNVALPYMARGFDVGLSSMQWVVSAYLLTLGALILVGGSLGDIFGEVRLFTLGVTAFGIASALCAAAPT